MALVMGFLLGLPIEGRGQKTFYAEVLINNFAGSGANHVTNDGAGGYRDYHLSGGDPCVSAAGATAFLMYPQRSDCSVPASRNFYLYFPAAATDDPDFPAACKTNLDPARNEYYVSAWRMYYPNLYGKTSPRNPVVKTHALFGFFCGTAAYSVQTDQQLTPTISGNSRRLTNTGPSAVTSSLYYPSGGDFFPVGVNNFEFSFDITVQKF